MTYDAHVLGTCRYNKGLESLRQIKEFLHGYSSMPSPAEFYFERKSGLAEAMLGAAECPGRSIVVACGFTLEQVRGEMASTRLDRSTPVIITPDRGRSCRQDANSSPFEEFGIVGCRQPHVALRKSIVRVIASQVGDVRVIEREDELAQYFSLRYDVWHSMGYLASDASLDACEWELDHFDRSATPIGLFTADGELVACARMVRPYGEEQAQHVNTITSMLHAKQDRGADIAFNFKRRVQQPFDILWEFNGFREHFARLVRQRKRVAEVSRVIVRSEYRGFRLAEAMVDSLATLAKREGIDVLLLACREDLCGLYRSCGFEQVPGLVSDKFLNIPQRSVVMERWIGSGTH